MPSPTHPSPADPNLGPASDADRREVSPDAGLCARCVHLQVLRSKTSTFVRCALSDVDERFPRYPPLPVRSCAAFEETKPEETKSDEARQEEAR